MTARQDSGTGNGAVEILAPAGSRESLEAAVRCGADAVYLGGKTLNARRGAANFSGQELRAAVSYCHVRGVKVYVTLNTVVFSNELQELEEAAACVCDCGADAVIVQDLAVAALLRKRAPSLPLHASTQMSVHNLDGVKALEQLGFLRAVLARELSRAEIEYISSRSGLEIECFVHGALCVCVSGQCYFSALLGGRSGNRGLCAQPCRLPFSGGGKDGGFALSLKDLSLVENVRELAEAGVRSLKIEGRLKRPEYVAAAVTACKTALDGNRPDVKTLEAVFSRNGFTRGYFEGNPGDHMFGVRENSSVAGASVLKGLAKLYERETQVVPVSFRLEAAQGRPLRLTAADRDGNRADVSGKPPEKALTTPLTGERAAALLGKTGGTPYLCAEAVSDIGDGLMVPAAEINALRRTALEKLTALRGAVKAHPLAAKSAPESFRPRADTQPSLRIRLQNAAQFSVSAAEKADMLIMPAAELPDLPSGIIGRYREKFAAELPRIAFDPADECGAALEFALQNGVTKAVTGNLGGIVTAKRLGFEVHGDFGLNVTNSAALLELRGMGLKSCVLSFENSLASAREISGMTAGILAYGYLPLMITRNRPRGVKSASATLKDRRGTAFRVLRAGGASEIYNSVPLYLGDKKDDLRGFDFATLYFTSEGGRDIMNVLGSYLNGQAFEAPFTRGLCYRKVL